MSTGLYHIVEDVLEKRDSLLELVEKHGTPFYALDMKALDASISSFLDAFNKEVASFRAYYALKLNHHPKVIARVVERGMGLDVGSVREIDLAVAAGCKDIMYFSPGKTRADLAHALKYSDMVTVNMDSFSELETLGSLTSASGLKIKAGVRVHVDLFGDWKKYGIPLERLGEFWDAAKRHPFIELEGIHFHTSRNKDASSYEDAISKIGLFIKLNFSVEDLRSIKYVDFGGGFEVSRSEGYYSSGDVKGVEGSYRVRESLEIAEYAQKIGDAIKKDLEPLIDAQYRAEPGRFICNNSMLIVARVADKNDESNIILDAGVNMVGWQRFEHEYFPLVNISMPAKSEISCRVWGNLCTTWDIWGYLCYADRLREGDVIVVPNQGALTYSLAQNFISSIPPVYEF